MIRNPPSVQRIRKSGAVTADTKILLQHIDNLVAQLERYENLDLTDANIMEVAGPATGETGGVDLWELGEGPHPVGPRLPGGSDEGTLRVLTYPFLLHVSAESTTSAA